MDEVQLSQGYRATQEDGLLFTTLSPAVPGTHLINIGKMKGRVDHGATQWFKTQNLWIKNPAP